MLTAFRRSAAFSSAVRLSVITWPTGSTAQPYRADHTPGTGTGAPGRARACTAASASPVVSDRRDQQVMSARGALDVQEVAGPKILDPRVVQGPHERRRVAVLFSDSARRLRSSM